MPTIHAVLIGINGYEQKPLNGCLQDVMDVKAFFEKLANSNEELVFRPKLLLAPGIDSLIDGGTLEAGGVKQTEYIAPTRDHILNAFDHFKMAEAGDICLLYYSGHGSFQPAPKEFWHTKSARQVETIIAVDSRPNGLDIIDKELGYQVWATMKDKENVHFLAIMDSCHAGDNMRGDEDIIAREDVANNNITPLEHYFGYTKEQNNFYQYSPDKKRIDVAVGKYTHLAAARENESAKELFLDGKRRGVFTYNLLKTLGNGGVHNTYQDLLERVGILVRNRVDGQIPELGTYGGAKGNLPFMNISDFKIPPRTYAVTYQADNNQWILHAGTMQGIYPSSDYGATILQLTDHQNKGIGKGKVMNADATTSTLIVDKTFVDDQSFRASILSLSSPKLQVFIEADLPQKEGLEKLIAKSPFVETIQAIKEASHIIRARKGQMALTKKGSTNPLFKRQSNESLFITYLEQVAKWVALMDRDNPNTHIKPNAIAITVEIIEGAVINPNNLDQVKATQPILTNPTEIKLHYLPYEGKLVQPAIRVRVECKTTNYFVGGLYLSSKFGINEYLKPKELERDGGSEPYKFELKIRGDKREYTTIPIQFDPLYHQLDITEVTDYLKIFVATKTFDLSRYQQTEIPLEEMPGNKSPGFGNERNIVLRSELEDWMAITIPIRIHRFLQ